jgi:enoyl-CoA hydratase/carnithine racemase
MLTTEIDTPQRVGEVLVTSAAGVIRAVIDRPAQRNAISTGVLAGLEHAVGLATATRAQVLVVSGAGGTFCAGADLRELARLRVDGGEFKSLGTFMERLGAILTALHKGPFVSLAVAEGYAVAGGCEILLACDLSLAATDARIGDRHTEYGLVPAAGGSVNLVRALAPARANYLLFTGELISGREAADWGIVTAAIEPDRLAEATEDLVNRLTSRSHDALVMVKHMIGNATRYERDDALYRERGLFLRHMASADVTEGLAAFRERRIPKFGAGA